MSRWTIERLDAIVGHKLEHGALLVAENENRNALYRLMDGAVGYWEDREFVLSGIPCQDGVNEHVEV